MEEERKAFCFGFIVASMAWLMLFQFPMMHHANKVNSLRDELERVTGDEYVWAEGAWLVVERQPELEGTE